MIHHNLSLAARTQVSLVRCCCYDEAPLRAALRAVVAPLGGLSRFIVPGASVMLKPNFLAAARPDHPSITHPDFVIEVAKLVQEIGGRPFIADSPAWGNMEQVVSECGLDHQAASIGVPIVQLKQTVVVSTELNGKTIRLKHGREVREVDVVLNLPKLKAHRQLGFTGAVKNMYGTVPGRRKALWHFLAARTDATFARKLVHHYLFAQPHLTLMDAIIVMEGNGPRLGTPRQMGLIVAGTDCVAIDTVCAKILGIPDSHRLILNAAKELQVGCSDLGEIEILGGNLADFAVSDFKLPVLIGAGFSPFRILRGYLRNWYLTRVSGQTCRVRLRKG